MGDPRISKSSVNHFAQFCGAFECNNSSGVENQFIARRRIPTLPFIFISYAKFPKTRDQYIFTRFECSLHYFKHRFDTILRFGLGKPVLFSDGFDNLGFGEGFRYFNTPVWWKILMDDPFQYLNVILKSNISYNPMSLT
jgi:hypothetical protein